MAKTLLLADDSVTIQKVVGLSFASQDVRLITVDNGDDAIAKARELRPDAILADVVMPGKSGYEVCEAIKSDPALAHIPVLLLTGTFEAFDEERARRCGASGHVAKPFEAQWLVERVRTLFAEARPPAAQVPLARVTPTRAAPPIAQEPPPAPAAGDQGFDFFEDDFGSGSADAGPGDANALDLGEPGDSLELDADLPRPRSDRTVAILPDEPRSGGRPSGAGAPQRGTFDASATSDDLMPSEMSMAAAPATQPDDSFDFDIGEPLAQETVLDPRGASGFDVSSSDLGLPNLEPPRPPRAPAPLPELDAELTPPSPVRPGAAPRATPPPRAPQPPRATQPPRAPQPPPLPARPAPATADDLAFAIGEPEPAGEPDFGLGLDDAAAAADDPLDFQIGIEEPARPAPGPRAPAQAPPTRLDAEPVFAMGVEDDLVGETDLEDLVPAQPEIDAPRVSAHHDPAGMAGVALAQIEPQLRTEIRDTLEKIAWESLGEVAEQIVRQAVERMERVAWEVIPQLAETLIREEIRKLKGEV